MIYKIGDRIRWEKSAPGTLASHEGRICGMLVSKGAGRQYDVQTQGATGRYDQSVLDQHASIISAEEVFDAVTGKYEIGDHLEFDDKGNVTPTHLEAGWITGIGEDHYEVSIPRRVVSLKLSEWYLDNFATVVQRELQSKPANITDHW